MRNQAFSIIKDKKQKTVSKIGQFCLRAFCFFILEGEYLEEELYTPLFIQTILEETIELNTNCFVEERIDFERAINSVALTGKQRLIIGCLFGLRLNIEQVVTLFNLGFMELQQELEEAIEIIEAIMNGYKHPMLEIRKSEARTVWQYFSELVDGKINIFDINLAVQRDLLRLLAEKFGDMVAFDGLLQLVNGVEKEEDSRTLEEQYPFHKEASGKRNAGNDYFYNQDKQNNVVYSTKEI